MRIDKEKCEEVANEAKMAFADKNLSKAEVYITAGLLLDGIMKARREFE